MRLSNMGFIFHQDKRDMAAPGMVNRFADKAGADRIIAAIADKCQQINVPINMNCLVPTMKQVAEALLFLVDMPGISERKFLNDLGERGFVHLTNQVNMIGHKTEGM